MKPLNEVYPEYVDQEAKQGSFYGPSNYSTLLESFGYEIVVKSDDDDYQGDSRVLFKSGDLYGVLVFGWGSCSGCDALQACNTMLDIEKLRMELHSSIEWGTASETAQRVAGKDWEGSSSWYSSKEATQRFIAETSAYFERASADSAGPGERGGGEAG